MLVESCGSRNSVLVNGDVLSGRQPLTDGDQVVFGPAAFEVHCDPTVNGKATTPIAGVPNKIATDAIDMNAPAERHETEEMDSVLPDHPTPLSFDPAENAGAKAPQALTERNSRINSAIADAIADASKSRPANTDQFAPSESMLPTIPCQPAGSQQRRPKHGREWQPK